MESLRKWLLVVAYQFNNYNFYPEYKKCVKNQWKPYAELKEQQEVQLRKIISFAYNSVPYYRELFDKIGINPKSIRKIEDLEKIPVLTKDIIIQNWDDLKPVNLPEIRYSKHPTGGTTGTPFIYRRDELDRLLGYAILYSGLGYGGYELGDKMVFFAGSSLGIGNKTRINKAIHELVRNIRKLSSFDMGDDEMREYFRILNSFRPRYIRGYPSSIYFFAKWVEEQNLELEGHIRGVFTTSEKLYPHMRGKIGEIFDCPVYDNYGLNDGGVSAFECQQHNGLHINTERSIMEVVDEKGEQLLSGEGKILATSLHNHAMPFIRYDTGDLAHITDGHCNCGRHQILLKEVIGRSVDILVTPEGKNVHGWFFLFIFWKYCKGIKEYQVVQKDILNIVINIVPTGEFDDGQIDEIKEIVSKKSPRWKLKFNFVDKIEKTISGKHKFIVNNI